MLQEKVRILLEAPLYLTGDLFDGDLIASEARLLQIVHRQHGIFHLLRASQINQRKALLSRLQEQHVGSSYLTSGVYLPNFKDYIVLSKTQQAQSIQLLDPKELATAVSAKLLDRETCVSLHEFVA